MVFKKDFGSKEEAVAFANSYGWEQVLDIQYACIGHCANKRLMRWVVSYDEVTFDELYPAMPIEL